MEDDEDTETSILKTHLIRETPALASPDLLSEVSEMKQDLMKMSAILTTDPSEKSSPMQRGVLEKGVEEMSGEPFEIMEKVKEDLEKVSEILRSGTYEDEAAAKAESRPYRKDEEWVLLSDCEIEEAKMMAAFESQKPLLKDVRSSRGTQRQKGANEDHKEYLLDVPVTSGAASHETVGQEKFTEVVLRRGGKKIIPTVLKDNKTHAAEVKKPARKKGPQGHTDDSHIPRSKVGSVTESKGKPQGEDSLLTAPSHPKKSPVSPVVEETPIGSIKDKVKALQKKVEEEQKGRKLTGSKPSVGTSEKKSPVSKDKKISGPKKVQGPAKPSKSESERLEETMSVRDLMRAFQTGEDSSKRKSGLFEHKVASGQKHSQTKTKDTQSSQSLSTAPPLGQEVSLDVVEPESEKELQISPEIRHSKDFSADIRAELEDNAQYQQFKKSEVRYEGSISDFISTQSIVKSDLSKHREPRLDSGPESSSESLRNEGEVHVSSEESDKHEGMAEAPETSPESLSSSPKQPSQSILGKASTGAKVATKDKNNCLLNSPSAGARTADEQTSAATLRRSSVKKAAEDPSKSECATASRGKTVKFDEKATVDKDILLASSKPPKARKLTKRGSETIESFLSDEETSDGQPTSTSADPVVSRADTQGHSGLVLPLRHEDSETLSPVAEDSITISHKDSLEGSPLMDDNSSHKTPDSIEPSPTKESPCCDSLESSPVEQKTFLTFPATVEQLSVTAGHLTSSKAPEFPPENLRSRLLRDQDGSADDDSCEQTSQLTSSGKSPLSPDTPSSEEVSYEVNPKTPDLMVLSMSLKPSVIPEDAEEDDESKCDLTQRKFTPEEEMFKMAAKIKTFDEMEQDAKGRKDNKKDMWSSQTMIESEEGQENTKLIGLASKDETSSVDGLGLTESKQGSEVAQSVETTIKVQPPSPFPAGVHESPQTTEDIHQTMVHTAASTDESAMEGPQSVSEKPATKAHQISQEQKEKESVGHKQLEQTTKTPSSNEGAANITDEQKEESLRKLRGSKDNDKGIKQKEGFQAVDSKSHTQTEWNVTDEVKGDHMRHTGASEIDSDRERLRNEVDSVPTVTGKAMETFKPEICIYDDTEEDDEEEETPKTKSRGVTARADADTWSAMREDDDAFAARVREEEQKILGLIVDRQSQGATPDTTPGRTPTEEGTPTSEQNPFLFQEGKLFEMTRSGAIDMTKRGYEEEGFAFFQVGEQPIEEALAEDVREEPGGNVKEVGLNLTLQIKPEESGQSSKEAADASLHSPPEDDQLSKSDGSKSRIPIKMGVSASAKTIKKNQETTEMAEIKIDKLSENSPSGTDLGSPDTVITDVQTAVSTVTRSVYSQQDQESSDSSPEDQHSVKELPKTPEKTSPTSDGISKSKTKPVSKSHTTSTPKKSSSSKEEEKPKSRIPVKAVSPKSETAHDLSMKRAESLKDKKPKLPVKPETRRKSETDTGPSVSSRVTRSNKAKSYNECDSTKKPAKKDQGHPASTEFSSKSKTLPSKLPVRGKPGQLPHSSTSGKKEQHPERHKQSIDFSEEISDEAAKLVERLAQAEKEKEEAAAMSDDESSTIDVSVIENEPFPDMQMPLPEDPLVIRPRWDDPVETQMERIPADKGQVRSQGIPITRGPFSLSHLPQHISDEGAASLSCS